QRDEPGRRRVTRGASQMPDQLAAPLPFPLVAGHVVVFEAGCPFAVGLPVRLTDQTACAVHRLLAALARSLDPIPVDTAPACLGGARSAPPRAHLLAVASGLGVAPLGVLLSEPPAGDRRLCRVGDDGAMFDGHEIPVTE